MVKPYPTTTKELAEFMERGWPEVRQSLSATERFFVLDPKADDNPRDKSVVFLGSENCGEVAVMHTTYDVGIPHAEGALSANNQKYFTEEHAVRASWDEFLRRTPPTSFDTGATPLCLIWRRRPECHQGVAGTFTIRSRYACIWRGPDEGSVITSSRAIHNHPNA